jgi:dephospho-CoA kinase
MKNYKQLQEGVYDPNIFQAVFLAGGPGSGKSFVQRTTTGGLGMKVVNSDDAFERLLKKAGLSLKMPASELEPRNVIRDKSKILTDKRKDNFVDGRLGLIIDGTGKDYDKIKYQADQLKQIGYETYMIFVNTSEDVAQERNQKRSRTLDPEIVTQSWNAVQRNIGKFQNYFGSKNFIIVDNNVNVQDTKLFNNVTKRVRSLVTRKVSNPTAKKWIQQQLAMKKR